MNDKVKKDLYVSLAVAFNTPISHETVAEYEAFLDSHYTNYEILLVDYASDNAPSPQIGNTLQTIPKTRYLKLAGRIWAETALAAGMENAIGDIVILGTLQTINTKSLHHLVETCCEGNDVVIGSSGVRKASTYRVGAKLFDVCFGDMIGYHPQRNDTGLRIVSRRAANAVMATPRFAYNLYVRLSNAGYQCQTVVYDLKSDFRKEERLVDSLARAISLVVYNTTTPLRIVNAIGIGASCLSLLISFYSITIRLFKHNVVEGWTTLTFFMSIQFFFLFIIVAFLGEYLARLLTDRNETSAYSVMYEKHSSVMLDTSKLNVKNTSELDTINKVQTGRDR